MWKVVKEIKKTSSIDFSCTQGQSIDFFPFLYKSDIVELLEKQLQIESSVQRFKNITHEDLKSAYDVFIYLNICPKVIRPWILFYVDLFQVQAPDKIILTLNRLSRVVGSQKNQDFQILAKTLMKKVKALISHEYIYNEYNDVTRNYSSNEWNTGKNATVCITKGYFREAKGEGGQG